MSPMSHQYPSSGPGFSPGSHIASSCPVSSASFNLGLFLSLSFMTLTLSASSFVECGFVPCVFMIRLRLCILDKMLYVPSVHGIRRSMRLNVSVSLLVILSLITWLRWGYSGLLSSRVTTFSFVIKKYHLGKYFETMQISFWFSYFAP